MGALGDALARVEPMTQTKVSALGIEEQRITVSAQDGAFLLPSAALVRNGEGWQVFVVESGTALATPATHGSRTT